MITDRELARYISSNLHLYLADEDKPVECKVVDVSKNNGGTVAGVQILMHGVDHGPVISMETIIRKLWRIYHIKKQRIYLSSAISMFRKMLGLEMGSLR